MQVQNSSGGHATSSLQKKKMADQPQAQPPINLQGQAPKANNHPPQIASGLNLTA